MRKLVPWGRSVAEYKAMFDLTDENLHSRILEYGCGTSALNALLHDDASLIVSYAPSFDSPKQELPFDDFTFDFALSSHYLFTAVDSHSELMHTESHIQMIRELARVANEVRIFPVVDNAGQASPLLGPVLLGLQQAHYGVEVREVPCSLYPKGNVMLRVWAQVCAV